ncbi:putative bifunctional diguanylate cyclase/phosphodiesterase [Shewanella sp. YIC-542]|uniref:putative bifunctional diguanylate cyclase/phosphodiesterase n=1 Tax=Shewanella mytili TaxID=3377111 RepID=UPI00398F8A3F
MQPQKQMPAERFRSLTWKQTNLVVFTALFFAIAISIVEILLLVTSEREALQSSQTEVLDSIEQPVENAVWALDDHLARQTLEGLLKIDYVSSAVITLDDGSLFVSVGNATPLPDDLFSAVSLKLFGEFQQVSRQLYEPAYLGHRQAPQMIGTLQINYSPRALTQTLSNRLQMSFIATLTRALLITLVLSLLFHRFLTQPIARIGEAIDRIDPESPDEHLLPMFNNHQNDELGRVSAKFNQILIQFGKTQAKLRKLATRDSLTGLPNRTLLIEALSVAIQRASVHNSNLVLLFIDLDRFKNINDSLGHSRGDQFLIRIAMLLKRFVGKKGLVVRLGGDEFVILTEYLHSPNQAVDYVEKLFEQLKLPIKLGDHVIHPSASVGIALYPDDGDSAEALLRHADIAMYSAKAAGSNKWAFFKQQMTERAVTRLRMEASLYEAIQNHEFLLHFQPQMNLQNGKLTGCEALIRWQRGDKLISPMAFIPIAEETGIILAIGKWVIEQSCKTLSHWQKHYGFETTIACNLSAKQFADPELIPYIKRMVMRYQIPPKCLEIEITETSFMNDVEQAIAKLQQLKTAGFGIAVDDFGTGYSSLSYLRRLPLTTLKIDRAFISGLPENNAIASTVLTLGKQLDLQIIAEGIETQQQFDWLKHHGCAMGQGYYFSAPVTLEQFESDYVLPQANMASKTTESSS